jgi:hypothetical protein
MEIRYWCQEETRLPRQLIDKQQISMGLRELHAQIHTQAGALAE